MVTTLAAGAPPATASAHPAETATLRTALFVGPPNAVALSVTIALANVPGTWTVHAAPDPGVAGRILAAEAVDVAIVGIAPHRGGLAFLEWLRRHHPSVVRLAAFEPRDVDDLLVGSNVAHQYVTTSMKSVEIAEVIGRTVALRSRLGKQSLVRLAGSMSRIPTVPRLYAELRALISDDDFSLTRAAAIIGQDPGLTVKVLQVVNSAYYGLSHHISDLPHAVSLMGPQPVASLVLGLTLSDQFSAMGAARRRLDVEWRRSILLSELARRVATMEGADPSTVEACQLGGLLHNVGRLLLAANMPERFGAITWPRDLASVLDVERSAFGAAHPELGALLLGAWGLEDRLVEAVAFYAEPLLALGNGFAPLTAVHVAEALTSDGRTPLNVAYLESIGLAAHAERWSTLVTTEAQRAEANLG
jgi:HD-like signal output (HDOD) protein